MDGKDSELMEDGRVSRPLRRLDWLIVGVDLAREVIEAVHGAVSTVEVLLCGQANHNVDQKVFQDEARRQIESLTTEE